MHKLCVGRKYAVLPGKIGKHGKEQAVNGDKAANKRSEKYNACNIKDVRL